MVYRATTIPADSRLFQDAAARHALPLALVLAIVEVESSFQVAAHNPEPPYRFLWDVRQDRPFRQLTAAEIASEIPPADFGAPAGVPRDAEWWDQQASWGLTQVMGAVARELGYDGPWLTELLVDPVLVVDLGCRHLARKVRLYGGPEDDFARARAAYNAGSPRYEANGTTFRNQDYVTKTGAALARWRVNLGG